MIPTLTNHTNVSTKSRLIAKGWTHPISNTNNNKMNMILSKWGKQPVSNILINLSPKTHIKMGKTLFITKNSPWNWKRRLWKSLLIKLLVPAKNHMAFMIELSSSSKKNKEKFSVESSSLSKKRSVAFKIDLWSTHILGRWWLNSATTQFTLDATKLLRNGSKKKKKTSEWSKNVNKKNTRHSSKSTMVTWVK